jgi:protein-L-isoaspartate(D-aspartate) O-methyltransferase
MLERIRQLGVFNRQVIKALETADRKLFIPREWQGQTYEDGPLPIGFGQTISQPYTVARMCELLVEGVEHKAPGTRVLEIGTGSGWQACILAKLFEEVYSIEIISQLSQRARVMSYELGVKNIKFKIGDGKEGWAEHGFYDAIICGANAGKVPEAWVKQLAIRGRIVCPVKGVMTRITKVSGGRKTKIRKEEFGDYSFVPLI